ncbi:MAG: urease accessory protein UreE [Burkholderiaceae bacterium]
MLPRATALADSAAPVTDVVELRFDQRERSRLRARLASGEEIGIDLPVGTVLHHGSRLELDGGRVVAVEAAIESLLEITADDGAGLARIAYHVGNRHVPIEIAGDRLRILPDHVLRAMVEGLGGRIREVAERFHPEAGAYGHGHVHGHHRHDDEGHGGRIHTIDPASVRRP